MQICRQNKMDCSNLILQLFFFVRRRRLSHKYIDDVGGEHGKVHSVAGENATTTKNGRICINQ